MIKKTLDSQKNTKLQNQTHTQWKCPENALQCQPWTLCRTKKMGDSSNAYVCLYRSQKLL